MDPIKNLGFNADRRKAAQSQFSLLLEQGILSRLFDFKLSPKAKIHKHKHRWVICSSVTDLHKVSL